MSQAQLEKNFYICDLCGKAFRWASDYEVHMRSHTGEKPYTCRLCRKSFSFISNFRRHNLIHTGVRPHKCTKCGKGFTTTTDLRTHLRVHSKKRDFECSFCGQTFKHLANLRRHIYLHTGEKLHGCNICGKSFAQSTSLKRHLEGVHSVNYCSYERDNTLLEGNSRSHGSHASDRKKRTYKCGLCGEVLDRFSSLEEHIASHKGDGTETTEVVEVKLEWDLSQVINCLTKRENDQRRYACDTCGKAFDRFSRVVRHINEHMGVPNSKIPRKKSFKQSNGLNHRVLSSRHPSEKDKLHKCHMCDKVFRKASKLKNHVFTHARKSVYKCDVCGQSTIGFASLQEHISTHLEVKGHFCSVCCSEFREESDLQEHMQSHTWENAPPLL